MPKVVGQDKSVTKEKTCKHCGAINEYLPNELRVFSCEKQKEPAARVVQKGFSCAGCGREIIAEVNRYPYYETPC